MIILAWIIGSILSYLFIAGILRNPFALVSAKRCQVCKDGVHEYTSGDGYRKVTHRPSSIDHHGANGSIQAAFWPFTAPWTLGSLITEFDRAKSKADKAAARRVEEITEAEHQKKLAQIRADEDAHLTRQLQDK